MKSNIKKLVLALGAGFIFSGGAVAQSGADIHSFQYWNQHSSPAKNELHTKTNNEMCVYISGLFEKKYPDGASVKVTYNYGDFTVTSNSMISCHFITQNVMPDGTTNHSRPLPMTDTATILK